MLRDISLKDISDGNKYTKNDLVRLGCNNCNGCSFCCEDMSDTIMVDPLDVYRLCKHFNRSFESFIDNELELRVVDGLILPGIKMNESNNSCSFLIDGRCSIHSIRPSFCRLFPLGRIYEDNGFSYFLQKDQCRVKNRSKVRISTWIGEDNMIAYEDFCNRWHSVIVYMRERAAVASSTEELQAISMELLSRFFTKGYVAKDDNMFYKEFAIRVRSLNISS